MASDLSWRIAREALEFNRGAFDSAKLNRRRRRKKFRSKRISRRMAMLRWNSEARKLENPHLEELQLWWQHLRGIKEESRV